MIYTKYRCVGKGIILPTRFLSVLTISARENGLSTVYDIYCEMQKNFSKPIDK